MTAGCWILLARLSSRFGDVFSAGNKHRMTHTRFEGGVTPGLRDAWAYVISWGLGLVFTIGFAAACWYAWSSQADVDLRQRFGEYEWFREGTYPHTSVERQTGPRPKSWTVYPPYVFPMFALLFEPGGLPQGRFIVEVLSACALVVLGRYGYRTLLPHGPAIASLGAVLGLAISGNLSAVKSGQFSIMCMGLVVLQMIFLDANRPAAAALCWTLAMVKPQIALPFAALFILRRRPWAMAGGFAMLALLSTLACWWTEVSVVELWDYLTRRMSLAFSETGFAFGPGTVARSLGLDYRVVLAAIATCAVAATFIMVALIRRTGDRSILPMAAVCSVIGMFTCYHRPYDNVMLFPAALFTTSAAAQSRRPASIALAVVFSASLVAPLSMRLLQSVPEIQFLIAAIWIAAGLSPVMLLMRSVTRKPSDSSVTF
jgi:hypothetical protein